MNEVRMQMLCLAQIRDFRKGIIMKMKKRKGHRDMSLIFHGRNRQEIGIPFADAKGDFYCRAVHGILHRAKDQQVCGIGCPYYDGVDANHNVICNYICCGKEVDHNELAVDETLENPMQLWKKKQQEIEMGKDTIFPVIQDMDSLLQKAYIYAATAHAGHERKGTGIPYFTHLITTLNYAMQLTDDKEILAAAVLHDTVEDTHVTLQDIENEFGSRIARYVEAETENKRTDFPAHETWEIRKLENIKHLQIAPYEVKIIVLSDKTANAESMVREWRKNGDALWEKFNQKDKQKHAWYYRGCQKAMGELNDTSVMKIYQAYLDELFG